MPLYAGQLKLPKLTVATRQRRAVNVKTRNVPAITPIAYPARFLLPGYAATLFLGAALLILVQPMVTKMILPHLGGSPSVWNTCMCFFQAVLLLGYVYAHVLATRFVGGAQVAIHGAVLTLAAMFLPLDLTRSTLPVDSTPVLWLIGRLAVTVGPPFFAISATAPLLQGWFSRTDHAAAGDPYFLYAASNAGSLLALLAYPLIVEPELPLWEQSRGWSFGLGLLAAGIIACWLRYRTRMVAGPVGEAGPRPAAADCLRWIAYSFVPASLLLAVTAYITTDLASAPLFWVVPLALYLATYPRLCASPAAAAFRDAQTATAVDHPCRDPVGRDRQHLDLAAAFGVLLRHRDGLPRRTRPIAPACPRFDRVLSMGRARRGARRHVRRAAGAGPVPGHLGIPADAGRGLPRSAGRRGCRKGGWRADLALPTLLLLGLAGAALSGVVPGWVLRGALVLAGAVLLYFSESR
jgi:hypothetical protein